MDDSFLLSALVAAISSGIGAFVGCHLALRKDFVTREEAIELARAIDDLRRRFIQEDFSSSPPLTG